ncbi:MAG: DNA polymerase domain-containing protein, partial [Nanoarchaeota archaeon]|nr:DNA polymerase domain-containing protein [Nanoarchaeota archaeon]
IMFPSVRMKDDEKESKGARKRYAGLKMKDGKEELEIVGLEAIRGDWTEVAKEFQRELLMKVFHQEEIDKFIKAYIKKILDGKVDSQLVYKKSIRKNLNEYTKTTPPHVKAARKLDSLDSNIIRYYITTDGPEPIQKLTHSLDYEHYIKKQIEPIANQILNLFGKNLEDLMKSNKQTKLF